MWKLPNPEQFLAPLFACSGVGVAVFDDQFRFQAINDTLAAINGLRREAHLGKEPRELLGPLAEVVEPYFKEVMFTGNAVIFEAKGRLATRQKPGHWIETYIPIKYAHRRITNVCALVLEVTEKTRLDEALFGLTGKLFYIKDHLRNSLFEPRRPTLGELDRDAHLLRSFELVEQCMTDLTDVLHTIRPTHALPRVNNGDARFQLSNERTSPTPDVNGALESSPLSPREHEVLRLLASNRSNKEIAAILRISVRTVESHRRRLMEKLGIHSLTELVRYAIRHRIVDA